MNDKIILDRLKETPEFRKMEEKLSELTTDQWETIKDQYADIITSMITAKNLGQGPDSEMMQSLIEIWKKHIDDFYYTCDKARMRAYYKLYKENSTYKKQLDDLENGLADYIADAIDFYLKNN